MSNEILKKNFLDNAVYFIKRNYKAVIILSVTMFIFFLVFLFYQNLNDKKNIKISKKQLVDQKDELDRLRKQLKGNKKKKIALLLTLLEELTNNE